MRLGEILVQMELLTPEQLKTVLASRDLIVVGSRIGTQIVERGLLDTDQISEALGRQLRVPAALQRHFDKADPAVVAMLKPNLAARYMAIPLVAARSGVKRIVVAMATPQDMLVVDDVAFALGARVEPMISAELAIARNLKRFYGIDVNLARLTRPDPEASAPPKPSSREIRALSPAPSRRTPAIPPPAVPEPLPYLAPPISAAVTLEDAVHRLSVAEHRDQIADILIDFMLPRFPCGIIFLLRGNEAQAWRGYAPAVDARSIETIVFPLTIPSMFRAARDRATVFRGPPPAEGAHLHGQIWKYLRCQAPVESLVIPVLIAERVIVIVYAHGADGSRLGESAVQELQAMCNAAGNSFVRLIQRVKDGHKPPTLMPL
jgi:hypothetical protein